MANKNTFEDRDKNDVNINELFKNKSADEILALKYFHGISVGGCLKKKYVTDEKHDELVDKLIGNRTDRKEEALARLGIEEEQVQEIPPVFFEGYAFGAPTENGRQYYAFHRGENIIVTPTKQLTWIFFGEEQLFVFQRAFDTVENSLKREKTLEYYYKDVTDFNTESSSANEKVPVYIKGCGNTSVEYENKVVEREEFKIVVPGDEFSAALASTDDNGGKIAAMKQKLREKKQS